MKRLVIIFSLVLISVQMGAQRWGVVSFSSVFLRSAPDYEAPLETQALMGGIVEITGSQGYWSSVILHNPSYKAWVTDLGVIEMAPEEFDNYLAAPKYICTAMRSRVLSRPSAGSPCISDLLAGDILRKDVSPKGRAVSSGRYVSVKLPDGRLGWTLARDVADLEDWAAASSLTSENIVSTAHKFLGIPYMWGGNTANYVDCSGLVWMVYMLNGIILPRNASQQARLGKEIAPGDAAPGDLMFFGTPASDGHPERISHVAIYTGDGKVIHASQVVRTGSIRVSDDGYIGRQPLRIRRITASDEGVIRITGDGRF